MNEYYPLWEWKIQGSKQFNLKGRTGQKQKDCGNAKNDSLQTERKLTHTDMIPTSARNTTKCNKNGALHQQELSFDMEAKWEENSQCFACKNC